MSKISDSIGETEQLLLIVKFHKILYAPCQNLEHIEISIIRALNTIFDLKLKLYFNTNINTIFSINLPATLFHIILRYLVVKGWCKFFSKNNIKDLIAILYLIKRLVNIIKHLQFESMWLYLKHILKLFFIIGLINCISFNILWLNIR